MIGSFGDVIFEVYPEKVRTFRDFQIQRSAKYAEHAIHGHKGLLEFTGLSAATASFRIRLDAGLGINPKEELIALRGILTKHEVVLFILDGEPQGDGFWVLESLDENVEIVDNMGDLIAVEVSLRIKEYVEINENGIGNEEFQNDYNGLGNW